MTANYQEVWILSHLALHGKNRKMKNKIIYLFLISLTLTLTGCFEEAPKKEEVHTVAWFIEHKEVMEDTLKKCTNNPGELFTNPNCINASEARSKQARVGKFVKSSGTKWGI